MATIMIKSGMHESILKQEEFNSSFMTDRPEQIVHLRQNSSLHCLQLIQQYLDSSKDSKMDFFKVYDKCGKDLLCPNI